MDKNIIIITDYAAPYEGNFIASLKELFKIAEEQNCKMVFLFPKRSENIEWMKKFIIEFKVDFFDENIRSVIKIIKNSLNKDCKNILYSHFARHKTQLAIKIFRFLHSDIKLVQHFHNHCKIPDKFPEKQIMSFAYKLYEGDLNIGCSESVMKSMPYKPDKITFVDNAIDFSRLQIKNSNTDRVENDKFIILMFGFDYYRKGVDLAIEALKDIAEEKNIVLEIALATNKEKIENIIKNEFNGIIPNWIKLLPPTDNVSEYYNSADIFLTAAREEGFCYSLVEATYYGKKCISSKIGGVPIQIPGIVTFESENIEDLRNKIIWTINSNDNKVDEAREYIINKYNLSVWADEIMNRLEF